MTTVSVLSSKTKSGKSIRVAVIPQAMAPGLECQYAASEIAAAHGCTHWRVIDAVGRICAAGIAGSDAICGSFGPQG